MMKMISLKKRNLKKRKLKKRSMKKRNRFKRRIKNIKPPPLRLKKFKVLISWRKGSNL